MWHSAYWTEIIVCESHAMSNEPRNLEVNTIIIIIIINLLI